MTTHHSVDDVRGSILLCDEVYRTVDGKMVICGTYTNWVTTETKLHFNKGLKVYMRLQSERPGDIPFTITIIDHHRPANSPPMVQMNGKIPIKDPNVPIEIGITLPIQDLRRPFPKAKMKPGVGYGLRLRVCLESNGKPLASCPLSIIFRLPGELPNALGPPSPQPDSESGQPRSDP